jgi:phospholipid-binding lipoprotein MlaA
MYKKVKHFLFTVFLCLPIELAYASTDPKASESTEDFEFNDNAEDNQIDPFENFNRGIFEFNRGLDIIVFRPLAELYRGSMPSFARDSIHNAISNLALPLTFVNDALQLDGNGMLDIFARFLINSTLGFVGLFDVATEMGIDYHKEDFGQTLASVGVESGAYLVLPILGSSTPRDLIGRITDAFIDPFNIIMHINDLNSIIYLRTGTDLLDQRERSIELIDRIDQSLDPYIQYRSLYIQNRGYSARKELNEYPDSKNDKN